MQAQHERPVEPQLMVGAQHAAVIPVDVKALVDGDTRSVGIPAVPDRDIGTVAPEDLNLFKFVDTPEDAFAFLRDGLTEYHLGGQPKKEKENEVLPDIAKTRP